MNQFSHTLNPQKGVCASIGTYTVTENKGNVVYLQYFAKFQFDFHEKYDRVGNGISRTTRESQTQSWRNIGSKPFCLYFHRTKSV